MCIFSALLYDLPTPRDACPVPCVPPVSFVPLLARVRVRALRVFSKYSSLTLSITTLSTLSISTLTSSTLTLNILTSNTPTLNTPYSLYSFLSSLF